MEINHRHAKRYQAAKRGVKNLFVGLRNLFEQDHVSHAEGGGNDKQVYPIGHVLCQK